MSTSAQSDFCVLLREKPLLACYWVAVLLLILAFAGIATGVRHSRSYSQPTSLSTQRECRVVTEGTSVIGGLFIGEPVEMVSSFPAG